MARRAVVVAGLLVLAGCSGLGPFEDGGPRTPPDGERLGYERGYWYDDPLSVTTDDGLNETERRAVLARTMARVERIRQLEFRGNVSMAVISRSAYRDRRQDPLGQPDRWNEQVWEALLLVGEDRRVDRAFRSTLSSSVQGYYAPGNDSIVLVSDSPTPTVDRTTLAHELVHALQDQRGWLAGSPATQDRQLARRGLTEGDAEFVERRYEKQCALDWTCRPKPGDSGGVGRLGGVYLVLIQPYATGDEFVRSVRDAGGWAEVNAAYAHPPNSTEQVIHPETYRVDEPAPIRVPDRSTRAWSRFDHDPVADTAGEASIYAMLASHGEVTATGDDRYEYVDTASAGWAGDAIVPYRSGAGEYGYVWEIAWDTRHDARQFVHAYRSVLRRRSSAQPTENVYVLPESDAFGDAFRVTQSGTRVTIVNGPTRAALGKIHPRVAG